MIEHVRDFRRVKKVWEHNILISSECYYLIEGAGKKDLGVWLFHPWEDGLMVHVNLNDECRGAKAAESARNAFKWIFENTVIDVIYAAIPTAKKHVHVLACCVGFEFVFNKNDNRCYKLERSQDMKMAV